MFWLPGYARGAATHEVVTGPIEVTEEEERRRMTKDLGNGHVCFYYEYEPDQFTTTVVKASWYQMSTVSGREWVWRDLRKAAGC